MSAVAVIDFSAYSLNKIEAPADSDLNGIAADIRNALERYNCFWMTNSGISFENIEQVFQKSKSFYDQPYDKKTEYIGQNVTLPTGYFPDSAKKNGQAGSDVGKQGFHYCPLQDNCKWPEESLVPGFTSAYEAFWSEATNLSIRIAECISLSLGMDRNVLVDRCMNNLKNRKIEKNWTTSRVNQYDPILGDIEDGTFRFASHCDWTMFTLLFASCDGLMMQMEDETWLPVGHKPDAILVQSGFLMETLTNGRIKPNRHRVDIPTSSDVREKTRNSIVHFVYPDNDVPLAAMEEFSEKPHDPATKKIGDSLVELLIAYVNSGNADHETSLG